MPILYALKKAEDPDDLNFDIPDDLQFRVMVNGDQAVNNKYVRVADKTQTIHFSSDDAKVVQIESDGSFSVEGAGVCNITLSLADKTVTLPFKILQVPLKAHMTKDEVVGILGLPDKRTSAYLEWPTKERVLDGITYSNDGNNPSGLSIEHWTYAQYPHAIFEFRNNTFRGCPLASWDTFLLISRSFGVK